MSVRHFQRGSLGGCGLDLVRPAFGRTGTDVVQALCIVSKVVRVESLVWVCVVVYLDHFERKRLDSVGHTLRP